MINNTNVLFDSFFVAFIPKTIFRLGGNIGLNERDRKNTPIATIMLCVQKIHLTNNVEFLNIDHSK